MLFRSTITVQLLAEGVLVDTKTVSGSGSTWSFSFTGLPAVREDGSTITYSLRETAVSGYTTTVSGTTITNTLIPKTPEEYIDISGTKTWFDENNESGSRPNYIIVRLLRNGVEIDRRTVTAVNGWQYSFTNLPADDGYGNKYTYTIREEAVPGYFGRVDGYNLSNTKLPDRPELPPDDGDNPPPPARRTPPPTFEAENEEELEEYLELFDYGTPLFGELLGTGDDTPIYPFIFGGVGGAALIALIVLLVLGNRKKGTAN